MRNNGKQLMIWMMFFLFTMFYGIFAYKSNSTDLLSLNYVVIIVCFFICSLFFLYMTINRNLQVCEPIVIVTVIYYFMFIYFPLRDINMGETTFFGQDFTTGAIKATVIFTVSYISFLLGYYIREEYSFVCKDQKFIQRYCNINIMITNIILWFIGFAANLIYIMSSGKDLLYIFSIGQKGTINSELVSSSPLGFVGMFGFLMVGSMMYILEFSNYSLVKVLAFGITLLLFLVRGFRFIIVVILVAPIIMHYLKIKKQPSIKIIFGILVGLLFMITIVASFRGDIRNGTSNASLSNISIETMEQVCYDNFGQYRPFYIMVNQIPQNYSYTLGAKTFINPLIMFIPRIIWKNKTFLGASSNNFLSQAAQTAGSAYCNIGEYYMDFGVIGCIVLMYILGRVLGKTKELINGKVVSIHSYIAYSIIVPLTMQIIIRGYMASNFNLIIFSLLPVWLTYKFDK